VVVTHQQVSGGGKKSGVGEKEKIKSAENMKKLVLAAQDYAMKQQPQWCYFPAYTVDANGKPLHSWRVLILPHIGEQELYGKIRRDEPWDSEYNKQFHDRDIECFRSAGTKSTKKGFTDFSMVVGPDMISNGPVSKNFREISDGRGDTILFVERATPVCWMDPTEVTQEAACLGIGVSPDGIAEAYYDGGKTTMMGLCDGSWQWGNKEATPEEIKAALTPDGGESLKKPWWY
jgi:hypothetical protein